MPQWPYASTTGRLVAGGNPDVERLLTSAARLLGQLPERVVQKQRGALIRTLGEAQTLVIEVECGAGQVRIRSGAQLLVEFGANSAG